MGYSDSREFTKGNFRLLMRFNVENVDLKRDTSEKSTIVDIDWKQLTRSLFGNKEQYHSLRYYLKGNKDIFFQVFVACDAGLEIPNVFNTSGHRGFLHFGLFTGKDGNATIFFVLHPNSWGPFQHRFQLSMSTSNLHATLNAGLQALTFAAGKLGPAGIVVGGLAAAGKYVGLAERNCGDYLRLIG